MYNCINATPSSRKVAAGRYTADKPVRLVAVGSLTCSSRRAASTASLAAASCNGELPGYSAHKELGPWVLLIHVISTCIKRDSNR